MLRVVLDELNAEWERLNAPICVALRPGLSGQQLADLDDRLGVELPEELRELWSWHDGADPGSRRDIGAGGYEFLTTDEVVAAYEANLQAHPRSPESDIIPEMYWHRSWVPFMTQGPQRLYVDAARAATSGLSPVRLVTWEWDGFDVDRAPSLRAAVSMWTWLLRSDYYRWDASGFSYPVDYAEIPLFARLTLA
jgi:cell wall assembly regulator SMI1